MSTKACSKCKESRSLSDYRRSSRSADGLRYQCKICENAYTRRSRKKHVAKRRAYDIIKGKKSRQENPEQWAAYAAKRRAAKLQRTPSWLDEEQLWLIKEFYVLAKERERCTGIKWHVDHVIPLQGDDVSGLHTPENLQVIPAIENLRKNKYRERSICL